MRLLYLVFLSLALAFGSLSAAQATPTIQEQAISISKELRDPASANQSLFESNSAQAAELKATIYKLLENGESHEEVLDYFASRFGRQIRYDPPMEAATAPLWLVPSLLILFFICVALLLFIRRKKVSK